MKLQHLFEKSFAEEHDLTQTSLGLGFNEKEQKWYGYSHRAYQAYGVGDPYFQEELDDKDGNPVKRDTAPKTCKTLDDAKKSAQEFANSVS